MTSFDSDTHDNKQRILEVAARMFAQKGFDAVSVREIAEAADITKPVIYYYFKNKQDVYNTLINTSLDSAAAIHEEIYHSPISAEEKLHRIMQSHFQFYLNNPDLIKILYDALSGHSHLETAKRCRMKVQQNFRAISDFIRAGQKSNHFRGDVDPVKVGMMFISAMNIFVMHQIQSGERVLSDEVANELVNILLFGIVNPNHQSTDRPINGKEESNS